jgi:chromosomal replication initiator protein
MTDTRNYAAKLERRLIKEFKEKFEDKLGYSPVVLTKVSSVGNSEIPMISLDELSSYFDPYLPELFGSPLSLKSSSRKRELVELRNIFCAIARMMRFTCVSIGEFLGGRDHTTVLHNVGTFNNLIETSESFREKYFQILTHIKESYESSAMDEFDQTQCQSQLALFP